MQVNKHYVLTLIAYYWSEIQSLFFSFVWLIYGFCATPCQECYKLALLFFSILYYTRNRRV